MKSYLSVSFHSEGMKPSEVVERLLMIGFKATTGNYDFCYEWDEAASVKDAIWFADKIHSTLKGCNVSFKLETIGGPSGNFPTEEEGE